MHNKKEKKRRSGILLHPSSLPGKYGIGSYAGSAYNFIDFLHQTGQTIWQILPLGPTGYGNSPYQCHSAFALNTYLIDLDELQKDGLLDTTDLEINKPFRSSVVEYKRVIRFKMPLLKKAYLNFINSNDSETEHKFTDFCNHNSSWLEDYALFMSLKDRYEGKPWDLWPTAIAQRDEETIKKLYLELKTEVETHKFIQYIAFKQWLQLKEYANEKSILIVGDIPLYVAPDSADAWSDQFILQLDKDGRPKLVAGVPPDYFCETGQLWGNPVYDWSHLSKTGFQWWVDRVRANLALFDYIRVDHFRGLAEYWGVPFGEETAINGKWYPALGHEMLTALQRDIPELAIIAEDLGVITDDVIKLRDDFGLMGMKILQFAFDSSEENDFLPHNYTQNNVAYTGTHDNDTVHGWYNKASDADKTLAKDYLNCHTTDINWGFIRATWGSVANWAIAQMQDILNLGTSARMNMPGNESGNWIWRMQEQDITPEIIEKLKHITRLFGR